jgi:hypothetical protein
MEIGLSPIWGTLAKNGAYGATANRAEVPPYSAGRRAPACVSKDGESLGPGGQTALPPYLGWSSTLPRCRDPGAGGNPVRASRRPATHLVFLGTLERLYPWRLSSQGQPSSDVPLVTATERMLLLACGPTWARYTSLVGAAALRVADLAWHKADPRRLPPTSEPRPPISEPRPATALLGEPWRVWARDIPCIDGLSRSPAWWYPSVPLVPAGVSAEIGGLGWRQPEPKGVGQVAATRSPQEVFDHHVQALGA